MPFTGQAAVRTTLNIDDPVLCELKKLQASENKSLGRLVSDLLAPALKEQARPVAARPASWIAKPMRARVNLADKEAVYSTLEREP